MWIYIHNNWNEFMKFWDRDTQQLVNRNRVLLHYENVRPHTARTTTTKIQKFGGIELLPHPVIQPWSCAFRSPYVSIHGPFLAWKKFRKHWSCGSVSHRNPRIKNQGLVPSRDNKPEWKMTQVHYREFLVLSRVALMLSRGSGKRLKRLWPIRQ